MFSRRLSPRAFIRPLGRLVSHFALLFLLIPQSLPAKENPRPLYEQGRDAIIKNYTFINDFSIKEAEREVSNELFWRYPLKIPKIDFPIHDAIDDESKELPRTIGSGRPIEHLNRGRIAFLEGRYDEAKATFLAARARYGKNFDYHRRNDYFIAWAFLKLAAEGAAGKIGANNEQEIRSIHANAATFLSWAFVNKREIADPQVDANTPKSLYNLAAIYFKYGRYAGSFGAATSGLDYLRTTGAGTYRIDLRRIIAEAMILNRSYLKAVQELDTAIRQDSQSEQIAAAFARVGDIYFDLNNYELAEDAYGLAIAIDADRRRISSAQMILRGESLFWMGRFSDAQKMLAFGLQGENSLNGQGALPEGYAPWAKLRLADGYFARGTISAGSKQNLGSELMDKAKLAYFQVEDQHPKSEAAKIARIRRACLELPYYQGKNVTHARELLYQAKDLPLAPQAVELSWACRTASYASRDRTPEMVNRVREFANLYPESRFLQSLAEPVRDVQAARFAEYLAASQPHLALQFFAKNRKNLYPKITGEMAEKLFNNYVDIYKSESAKEFWHGYRVKGKTPLELMRAIVFTAEMHNQSIDKKDKSKDKWAKESRQLAKAITTQATQIPDSPLARTYLNRVLYSQISSAHLPWIYDMIHNWTNANPAVACELEFPLMAKIIATGPGKEGYRDLLAQVLAAVDGNMPGLAERDYECANGLLELENSVLENKSKLYAKRWLARIAWPLVPQIVHHLWLASELIYEKGEMATAKEIWRHLAQKAPPQLPETRYAQIRLDPKKTEFEGLFR